MQSGKLDQLIELQSLAEANNSGELVQSWAMESIVWAYVLSQHGSESFEAARTNARQTIRVQLRYLAGVSEKWRLIWQGKAYNIKYVDESQRRKGELWLTAEIQGDL